MLKLLYSFYTCLAIITTPPCPEVKAPKDNKVQGNWTVYTSLSSIGITPGTETIESIVLALPENSSLVTSLSANSIATGIYPSIMNGQPVALLKVTKISDGRIRFDLQHCGYITGTDNWWVGKYYKNGSIAYWSGWKQLVDMDTFSAAIAELTVAIASK